MTGASGLLNAALVGSSRIAVEEALPATAPEGGMVGALSDVSAEQRLLLAAGVRAIYRLAGYAPERVDVPLEPAPAEAKMGITPRLIVGIREGRPARYVLRSLGRFSGLDEAETCARINTNNQ